MAQDQHGLVWLASDTDGLIHFDGYLGINWFKHDHREFGRQNVNSMLFTQENILWLGSWGQGLSAVNLVTGVFQRFQAQDNQQQGLAANRIHTLYQDSLARIWIGTVQGLNYIEASAPELIQRFAESSPAHPLYEERIWSITEFSQALWFATSNHLYKVSMDLHHLQKYQMPSVTHVADTRLAEIRFIGNIHQQLLAASTAGVFIYSSACDCFKSIKFPDDLPPPRVNTLLETSNNTVWVGAIDGLYLLDLTTLQWQQGPAGYNYLRDIDVRSLHLVDNEQLWVGSRDQGLLIGRVQHQGFKPLILEMPTALQNDGNRLTSAVLHDRQGRLWLSSNNKILYRDQNATWLSIDVKRQNGIQRIYKIAEDPEGKIWFATDQGLFQFNGMQLVKVQRPFDLVDIPSGNITSMFITEQGEFYLNLWQQGLLYWQPALDSAEIQLAEQFSRQGNQIYQINQSTDGVLFASSRYSGILMKRPTEDWQKLNLPITQQLDGFNCVLPAGKQAIWLCSEFGLWYIDREHAKAQHFLTEHGLPSVNITGAFFHSSGELWVLTNNGPARYDHNIGRFISYSLVDGLPDLTLQRNAVSVSASGEMILGTAMGAVQVMINSRNENLNPPKVLLNRIEVNAQAYYPAVLQDKFIINLPYNFREFLVNFTVLDYREPEMNQARSRLLGLTDRWQELDKQREIRILSLKPGQYVLEIEGQNSRGLKTVKPIRLELNVAAPWWYSKLFWLSQVLFLIIAVFCLITWREANLKQRNTTLAELVKARTLELEKLTEQLQQKADHDPLTGLLNRRGFEAIFLQTQAQAARQGLAMSLVLLDLDHFKRVNDRHGHDAGDRVLQFIAHLLQERIRKTDYLARWGGEEFVILLPDTDLTFAGELCEHLLQLMKTEHCHYQQELLSITATFGVCSLDVQGTTLEQWIKAADEALYQGKSSGRAKVVLAAPAVLS